MIRIDFVRVVVAVLFHYVSVIVGMKTMTTWRMILPPLALSVSSIDAVVLIVVVLTVVVVHLVSDVGDITSHIVVTDRYDAYR
jgi:hypothetical protein